MIWSNLVDSSQLLSVYQQVETRDAALHETILEALDYYHLQANRWRHLSVHSTI